MTDITWHHHLVTREERERLLGHAGCVVWFTGLSGSGKSTVANAVDRQLHAMSVHSYVLDGDNLRHGLNASPKMLTAQHSDSYAQRFGLGFSAEDRKENIRRIAAVGQLFVSAGLVALTAFVSPYRRDRDAARRHITEAGRTDDFIEVFVNTPLEICESRDPKGLYKKARAGEINNLTGIGDPYEPPAHAELTLAGGERAPGELAMEVVDYLKLIGKIHG